MSLKYGFLSGSVLKILACVFMFIDHLGVIIFPDVYILRAVGRLAMPIFAWMLAEGCFYTKNKLNHFNLSVMVDDDFMLAVENGTNIKLHWPIYNEYGDYLEEDKWDSQFTKEVNAKELWNKIIRLAYDNGEPGIFQGTTMREMNPANYVENIIGSNPCAEYLAGTIKKEGYSPKDFGGACNLGSIFLYNFVKNPFTNDAFFDGDLFCDTVRIAVRMLDDIIDVNVFPNKIYENYQKNMRTIGLGVTGFADCLAMLGLRYGSQEAINFTNSLFENFKNYSYQYSSLLASEKGNFPFYDESKHLSTKFIKGCNEPTKNFIRLYGLRNAKINAIAPVGTLSIVYGNNCSSGIEPIFSLFYERKVKIGGQDEENISVVKMEDYAYALYNEMVKNNEPVDYKPEEIFPTAMDLTVDEHINMLEAISKHIDMSVSKCVAKGTKIQTNHGIFNIEDMGNARGNDIFGKPLANLKVKDHNGNWQLVTSQYSGGIKPPKKIRFNNGFVLECSLPHKFMNDKYEWIKAEDLRVGDKILYRIESYNNEYPNINIDTVVSISPNSKPVILPNKMTDEFALLLGMLVADGHTCLSTGLIGITTNSNEIENKFIELVDVVFNRECHIIRDKRTNDTRQVAFNSRAAARFIRKLIGENCVTKHTPKQILLGAESHMRNFIAGVTLDGYVSSTASGVCLYEGYSKQLRDEIASMCNYLGVEYRIYHKYVKTGRKLKYSYGIKIYNKKITPFESDKQLYTEINLKRIPIPDNFENYKPNTAHPSYSSYRMIHQGLVDSIQENVANNLGIPNNGFYVLKVASIEESMNEVYDIEVENTHSYLIDGIVSHNTINIPTDYSFEDTKEVYMECWKKGIKGCTIFRPNEIRQGILIDETHKKEAKETPSHTLQRGDIIQCSNDLIGKKRKIISGCGGLHILAYFDLDTGDMMEVYLNMGSQGGCLSNTNAISRLLSLLCRAGVDVNTIKDQLDSVVACPAYVTRTATKHDTSRGKSCPSAIGFALIDMWNEMQNDLGLTEEEKKNKPITTVKTQFKIEPAIEQQMDKCPECGSQVNYEGGCVVCRSCGWSKCS